jgi:hypothetical protein
MSGTSCSVELVDRLVCELLNQRPVESKEEVDAGLPAL